MSRRVSNEDPEQPAPGGRKRRRLAGVVVDEHGRSVANALVAVVSSVGANDIAQRTGEDGRFMLTSAPEGQCAVVATSHRGSGRVVVPAHDENQIVIQLTENDANE